MNLDRIVRCRDCEHSGARTKRKTSTCALSAQPVALNFPMNCEKFKERKDKPAQKKWKANLAVWIAFMKDHE